MRASRGRTTVSALALAVGVWWLSGCAGWPSEEPQGPPVGATPETHDAASLVAYAHWVHTLSPKALDHLYYRLLAENSPTRPIRLAVALSHPEAPFRDVELARQLLDGYLRRPHLETRCCREFAAFLRSTLDAHDSHERTRERLARLREAHAALEREATALRASAEEERAHRIRLERQIEALKAIEMDLNAAERRAQSVVR
ncbi:MAG: hypothetical protein GWN84_12395 [Gammaproteobacteria bacterium]|nr:hypothetical protein [Gammaproteobacteria bacterium]NIR83706.1 hypothetical protein [Gammaproteobacteria bacterium]NIR91853.1 hypothetical protein [Gammaproteobacteria bacterium]NIU04872.1 hypothetical protein [Gammaproteobacteria bacterium]NIV51854.1 hypothetical protein [Gammaproteobacteria bacterium]